MAAVENKKRIRWSAVTNRARKRVLAIMAGILGQHLKTA